MFDCWIVKLLFGLFNPQRFNNFNNHFSNIKTVKMKNFYFTLLLLLFTSCLFAQDEEMELIPGAMIGSCIEPDSNLIILYFDYNKNCAQADPSSLLSGVDEIGFHSGINNWSTIVEFTDPKVKNFQNIGNNIFELRINTMEYYGTAINDIETLHFVGRSVDPNDSWDAGIRDDEGGGGFGMDEPCNDLVLTLANLPVCSEVSAESSASLMGATTAANSCINAEAGTVTIQFDNSLNCPEADPEAVLAGATALGFHSGANDWASTVEWDAAGAMQATNNGNDIFSVTIDPMAYYGIALADLQNIQLVMNNGVANPAGAWDATGKDERDGGFGGAEPCSDLVFVVAEAQACPVVIEKASSAAILAPIGDAQSCKDPATGNIKIAFDNSLNCPEADPEAKLAGATGLGFHSGANDWAVAVSWDAEGATTANNNGSDVFIAELNVMDYYGIPFDSLTNIKIVMNNGVAAPEDAWSSTGKDARNGGFGGDEPCSDLVFDMSEVPTCDLAEFRGSSELTSGLAMSCVDKSSGKIRIDFDRALNCAEADPTNMLGDTIGFHSGINNWQNQVAWDAAGAMSPSNDGNGLYSMVLDVQSYYGISIDSLTEVNFLYNNGIAMPDDAWTITGKTSAAGGGFGGEDPCSNFLFVVSELPACDLSDKLSSAAILASSCADPATGKIKVAFDNSLNCPEADSSGVLAGAVGLGFHSGANDWATAIAWDAEDAMQAVNNGSDVFEVTLDVMEYYGMPFDSLRNIKFVMNNGVVNPTDAWSVTGKDARNGGFGGDEPCSDLVFTMSEVATCDLSDRVSSAALISGLAASCIDPSTGNIRIDFDMSLNCSEADPGNLLVDAAQAGFHSGINNWSVQKLWDEEGAKPAVNNGENLFSVTVNAMDYYGVPLSEIGEINFLLNNGFGAEGADPWANTGKDETGTGGFGGDELCDNLLFIPSQAATCELSTSTLDLNLESSMKVMPNPFSSQVLIQFDNPSNKNYELLINDLSGRVIQRMTGLSGNQVRVQRKDMPAGMYIAQLRDEAGNFATTKLVVE